MTTKADLPKPAFEKLCRLERKLHKWAEEECNGTIQWEDQECTIPRRYTNDRYGTPTVKGAVIPNGEAKWLKEAEELARQCGGHIYHQGDPRGCALYFYRDCDVSDRKYPIDSIYSSVAVPCCFGA